MDPAQKPVIIHEHHTAGESHDVVMIQGGRTDTYRREPCEECPWRKDRVGNFPAEAFRCSAPTAYDQSDLMFACHMQGIDKPAICAGFLMANSFHNKAAMERVADGRIDADTVTAGGHELHESYRDMAMANGVSPDDPVLEQCKGNNDGQAGS